MRLALTRSCNLRCDYCMPGGALLNGQEELSSDQFMSLVAGGARIGIRKVRLTGGEPLLYDDLIPLIRRIKGTPGIETIHITTNGILLEGMAAELVEAGLDSINISLDTLDREKYRRITRCGSLDRVLAGIEALERLNFRRIKINTVLMKGVNDGEGQALIDWAVRKGITLRFIEMMPIGEGQELMASRSLPVEEMIQKNPLFRGKEPVIEGTARCYTVEGSEAQIGFITPMRGHFCGRCNKIRINALGEMRLCLMSEETIPLKELLHDEELLVKRMSEALGSRPSSGNERGRQDSPMYTIGG